MFSLSEIFMAIAGVELTSNDLLFSEAVIDSRQLINGTLFVALSGENTDGHQYVNEAFRKGAQAALVSRSIPGTREIDLRAAADREALVPNPFPRAPFCIRVDDPVAALQKIAAKSLPKARRSAAVNDSKSRAAAFGSANA